MMRLWWLLALVAGLTVGCGGEESSDGNVAPIDGGTVDTGPVVTDDMDGDEWRDAEDNCPALFNPEQRDRDRDGIGDLCDDPCAATPNDEPNDCIGIDETEPNENGEAITLAPMGQILQVTGTIEAPQGPGQPFDAFRFMVPARTMLRIRMTRNKPESLLEPGFYVEGGGFTAPREVDGLFVAERDVYVAEAGEYTIVAGDRRGLFGEQVRGSIDYGYALSIAAVEVEPRPFVLENIREIIDVDPSVEVVFEGELPANDPTIFVTRNPYGQGISAVGVDAILMLERSDGQVIENDNLTDGFFDARIITAFAEPESVRLIVTHRRVIGDDPDARELELSIVRPAGPVELEPNDLPSLASRLIFPGETRGQINAPLDRLVGPGDVDYYYFDGTAGQVLTFFGLIASDNSTNPVLSLVTVDREGAAPEVLYLNSLSSGTAPQIQAILPETRRYYLVVEEDTHRNQPPPPEPPNYVGGGLYNYSVFVEIIGVQAQPNNVTGTETVEGTIDEGGRLLRYLVIPPEPVLYEVETLTALPPNDHEPYVRVYNPGPGAVIGEGLMAAVAYLPATEAFIMGVHNDVDGLGGQAFTFELQATMTPLTAVNEVEPNDEPGLEDDLRTPNEVVLADIGEGDVDRFTVTASAGDNLEALVTVGGRGRQVLILDDMGVQQAQGLGGATLAMVPAVGNYVIRVSNGEPGPYTLIVRIR